MKLIPMTDFVLEQYSNNYHDRPTRILNYARFLKQPLKLWMFVPCDEMGEVMNYEEIKQSVIEGTDSWDAYEQAKEKVLFEGFEAKNYLNLVGLKHKTWDSWYMGCYKTVEDLSGQEVELTPTAIKQIQP